MKCGLSCLGLALAAAPAAAQFTQLPDLPQGVVGHSMVTTQGSVFVLGGEKEVGGSFYADIVYRAPVTGNGALGSWVQEASLPRRVFYGDAVAWNDRIYVGGGYDYDGTTFVPSNEVHFALVAANGTPGPWIETTPLPQPTIAPAVVAAAGAIYVTGGIDFPGDFRDVWRAVIQPDGSLGPWIACTPMPRTLYLHASVATDRIYLLGGVTDNGSYAVSDVLSAPILGDQSLGTWTATTSLPAPTAFLVALRHGQRMFAVGGDHWGPPTAAVHSAAIDGQGGVGAWTAEPSLPTATWGHDAVVVGDWMYVAGGSHDNGTPTRTVLTMNLAACSGAVYVDGSYSGPEQGTQSQPFDTLVEGLDEVCDAGTIWLAAGTYDEPTPLSITQPVALKSLGGEVTVR